MKKVKSVNTHIHQSTEWVFKEFHEKKNKVERLQKKIEKAEQDLFDAKNQLPEVREDFKQYKKAISEAKKDPRFIYSEKDADNWEELMRQESIKQRGNGSGMVVIHGENYDRLDLVWYLCRIGKSSDGSYYPNWSLNSEYEGRDEEYYGRSNFIELERDLFIADEDGEDSEHAEENAQLLKDWNNWLAEEREYLGFPKDFYLGEELPLVIKVHEEID